MHQKFDDLLQEVHSLKVGQSVLLEASADQTATIKSMGKQQSLGQVMKKFPIQTVEKLHEISQEITETNIELYIDAMKNLMMPGGMLKNLKNILANTVVLAYNVDGVQGKIALKSHIYFYKALLDAINKINDGGPAEDQLRRAMQLQKKRPFKNKSSSKRNEEAKLD